MLPLLALVAVTAIWGVTFVQVKDAVALYPLFAFLALRFAIASAALALPGYRRVGCALILAGILVAEPAAAEALRRLRPATRRAEHLL
jgi:hypothetical protein